MPDGSLPARHEFTKRLRAMIFERANGCCESCGCKVGGSIAYDIDHIVPAYAGGKATLENGQVLCKALCHREKTRRDNRAAKKSNRIRGLTGQRARRAKRGGSSVQGRGFSTDKPDGYVSPLSKAARRAAIARREAAHAG